ncbi:hypothetical protein PHYPSEUDO_003434 [Phytophthora pseudosyringae]|uniref:Uncharacterized protein n=1 Tax=Phytophthora pseudosyringae TaxID=221518 RepID=A0A8T1WHJ5_9STRA|nr:hypothetical protein PHYPSEUDO_003434 [Phytophthora pseudosyringae]
MWRQEAAGRDESLRVRPRGELTRAMQSHPQQQQQQPLATTDAAQARFAPRRHDQMDGARAPAATSLEASRAAPSQNGDRNWSARIHASIARLMEVEGISLDSEKYAKPAEKRKARVEEQAFHAKVEELEAASETAHKEYWDRLRDVYSASTAKKMRLTSKEAPPQTVATSASWQPRCEHEALNTLAVAAATEQFTEPEAPTEPTATNVKKTKPSSRRQNSLPVDGTERSPLVQVHDPSFAKAVDKLAGKLTQLLVQLQATSDAAAAEPILAAAASIALEATEIRRCEKLALTRMVEIEEHRQQVMQGILEYSKRTEQQEMNKSSKEGASSASDLRSSSTPPLNSGGSKQT